MEYPGNGKKLKNGNGEGWTPQRGVENSLGKKVPEVPRDLGTPHKKSREAYEYLNKPEEQRL